MRQFVYICLLLATRVLSDEGVCYSHVQEKCGSPGEDWQAGDCNSLHGNFRANSDNLHRIIIDDFTDSMNYLLMASAFSTDKVNRMGFSKYYQDQSDKMWSRGKDMIKYVLKRGGKMGTGFQIPPFGANNNLIGDFDYSNEMKSLGVNLDLMKNRAEDVITAYRHSLSSNSFDPEIAHKLEELSEEYSGEINDIAKKINNLGKMVRNPSSSAMGLHLFDKSLL